MRPMKTNSTTKDKNKRYGSAFIVTVVLESLLYLIVIGSALAMVASLLCAIYYYAVQNCCYGEKCITFFGIFATVSFVPILGLVATMISAYRNSLSEIEGDLAKCTGIEVQFRLLPYYANTDTFLELQQSVNEERKVLSKMEEYKQKDLDSLISEYIIDYDYQVVLDFKQDLAELYKITLCDLKVVDADKPEKSPLIIRDKECITSSVSVVKDLSGIKRDKFAGEHACVFVKRNEDNERTLKGLKEYIKNIDIYSRKLICTLNFQKREFLGRRRLFPISRKLLDNILTHSLRRKIFVVELAFDSFKRQFQSGPMIVLNNTVFELNITNVSFGIAHNLSWSKYLAQKLKMVGGDVNNAISQ